MKNPSYDKSLHASKACCEFGMCNYKEARAECEKAPDSDLKVFYRIHDMDRIGSCCTSRRS